MKMTCSGRSGMGVESGRTRSILSPRRTPERARLAVVPRARVVNHHDPAEGEEATQAGHLTGGEVGHRLVAAEVEEGGVRDRRLVGVHRRWGRARGGARPLRELVGPARRGRGVRGAGDSSGEQDARVEGPLVAERARRARKGEQEQRREQEGDEPLSQSRPPSIHRSRASAVRDVLPGRRLSPCRPRR